MIFSEDKELSRKIKEFAFSTGFDLIGIAPVRELNNHKEIISKWVAAGMNADMNYLSRDLEKRTDPSLLFPGARSVIVAGINYYPDEKQGGNGIPVISKYAYGKDYHTVLGEKFKILLDFIISCKPAATGKICIDSSSILEKAWANEAGLGSIGRNSLLINKRMGSFIFLGAILVDIELEFDNPSEEDLCTNCRRCIDACPTKAINANKTIDARKCIAWVTIENKNEIPECFEDKMNDRIFGCDICQDICPWNINAKPHNNTDFKLAEKIKKMSRKEWQALSAEDFSLLFQESPLLRAGYRRFKRNIDFIGSGHRESEL
jgi:epoxyqueuosine reductase